MKAMSKKTKYFLVSILLFQTLINPFISKAQQEQLYIAYPFMPLTVNPAYAGSREVVNFTAIYRRRPLFSAVVGTTVTTQQYLTFDMPIAQDKMAIGFQAYNADQVFSSIGGGVRGNLGLYGDFAYRIALPNDGKLAFGVQVGVTQVPVVFSTGTGGSANSAFNSSLGGGIYYHNDDAYLGVSFLNFNATAEYAKPLFVTGGYVFTIDDEFKIKTGALLRRVSSVYGSSTDLDLNATAWINNKFGIGLWYQNTGSDLNEKAFLASFQLQLKKLQIGYAYDFSGAGNVSTVVSNEGFHQLMFKYEIDSGNGKSAVFKYF
jgi:type IX secretion system PorP/SprF family membrane protein